ncbi:MAG: DNA/RNA nuclease SfsA [Methanosphaera sp.]|nr:DNA/RNA nuclease SfsA [Methanosphaera sp.]
MEINNLKLVYYVSRPNRFTVEFREENHNTMLAHLHDPGRLKELLIPDTPMLIKYIDTYKETNRKTKYDVIAIKNKDTWLLLNSSYHNRLVNQLIDQKMIEPLIDYHVKKPEYTYGNSRLDFLLENEDNKELYLEVKGCSLLVDDVAMFPDAPTERGRKHLCELIGIKENNMDSAVIILILHNKAKYFMPNYITDPDFAKTLKQAYDKGVKIYPVHIFTEFRDKSLYLRYNNIIPIKFREID